MEQSFERERRFIVRNKSILKGLTGEIISQGYLFSKDGYVVRVRRMHYHNGGRYDKEIAMFGLKGPRYEGAREEYEWEIPSDTAANLMQRSLYKLTKTRYELIESDGTWDVDEFHLDNEGLIIAEYEARDPSQLTIPDWCGEEITDDKKYNNENLAKYPFKLWRH